MFILKKSELMNFGYALMRVATAKEHEKGLKKSNMPIDPEIKRITGQILQSLSPVIRQDLEQLVRKYYLWEMMVILGRDNTEMTPQAFLEHISGLSAQGFLADYRRFTFNLDPPFTSEQVKEKIKRNEASNIRAVYPTWKEYLVFEREIQLLFPRIRQFLEAFYGVYQSFSGEISRLQQQYEAHFEQLMKDRELFAQKLFVIDLALYDYRQKDVWVNIILFREDCLSLHWDTKKDTLDMHVGIGLQSRFVDEAEAELDFFKCLADPTKRQIIELIVQEKICARDIAKKLKLTKATISYHLGKLVLAGILKISLQEGKKAYYQVQRDVIRRGFDQYLDRLKADDENQTI